MISFEHRFASLAEAGQVLDRATVAIQKASRRLGEASVDGMDGSIPLLEDALRHLDDFNAGAGSLKNEDRRELESRAGDLKDSLVTFLALASQFRAYYESFAGEVARGQLSYNPASMASAPDCGAGQPFAEM